MTHTSTQSLIVTIIILIILAGVALSMLRGDNGIINSAQEAKVASVIGAFKEKVAMTQLSLETEIRSKTVKGKGYIATEENNFKELARSVAKEFGIQVANNEKKVKEIKVATTSREIKLASSVVENQDKINTEGYTVGSYLDTEGSKTVNGVGYICIWYTSNGLRSSVDREKVKQKYGLVEAEDDENNNRSRNQLVLVATIRVQNYGSELVNTGLTSIATANSDIGKSYFAKVGEDTTKIGKNVNYSGTEHKISAGVRAIENSVYTDSNGAKATIPAGFTVSRFAGEQNISTGLVIYDIPDTDITSIDWTSESIKENYNQFVWVPCSGTGSVTYEKKNGVASTWRKNYSGKQYWYTTIGDDYESTQWHDEGGNTTSVEKYGGFYVARYEAGVPENASFYANSNGSTYNRSRNVSTYIPVSKKRKQSWNFISQANSKTVSNNMYNGSTSVTSSLIDSYAWDTIVEWMKTESGKSGIGLDSRGFGNYYDNGAQYRLSGTDVLYAEHRYDEKKSTASENAYASRWNYSLNYKKGDYTTGHIDITTDQDKSNYPGTLFYNSASYDSEHNYTIRSEVATGSIEGTKIKNIYDMAGNMWEWTTEVRDRKYKSKTSKEANDFSVLRGGSFSSHGNNYPVSYRNGHNHASSTYISIGFRAVLYVK